MRCGRWRRSGARCRTSRSCCRRGGCTRACTHACTRRPPACHPRQWRQRALFHRRLLSSSRCSISVSVSVTISVFPSVSVCPYPQAHLDQLVQSKLESAELHVRTHAHPRSTHWATCAAHSFTADQSVGGAKHRSPIAAAAQSRLKTVPLSATATIRCDLGRSLLPFSPDEHPLINRERSSSSRRSAPTRKRSRASWRRKWPSTRSSSGWPRGGPRWGPRRLWGRGRGRRWGSSSGAGGGDRRWRRRVAVPAVGGAPPRPFLRHRPPARGASVFLPSQRPRH